MVQLYANGLGAVDNPPPTGVPATVLFSGLAPGFPGLDQVNFVVPENVAPGVQPVVLSVGGAVSAPVNLPIQ